LTAIIQTLVGGFRRWRQRVANGRPPKEEKEEENENKSGTSKEPREDVSAGLGFSTI
jgi:hypothetical protein